MLPRVTMEGSFTFTDILTFSHVSFLRLPTQLSLSFQLNIKAKGFNDNSFMFMVNFQTGFFVTTNGIIESQTLKRKLRILIISFRWSTKLTIVLLISHWPTILFIAIHSSNKREFINAKKLYFSKETCHYWYNSFFIQFFYTRLVSIWWLASIYIIYSLRIWLWPSVHFHHSDLFIFLSNRCYNTFFFS